MRFAVAGKVSDHYLCAWGELSSSGRAIHPGEAPQRPSAPTETNSGFRLQQAEFSRPADRRAAVLNAELAVHGALVGLHGIERDV
jgi:hypothetical protein